MNTQKRPFIITLISIIGFIGVAFALLGTIAALVNPEFAASTGTVLDSTDTAVVIASIIAFAVAFIGYWKMRKWGVYLYTVVTVAELAYSYITEPDLNLAVYLIPALVIVIGVMHLKRMS